MAPFEQTVRLRFEGFELDLRTRELRKEGRVIKLQDQPLRLLTLLANRAGTLVTRAEIEKDLWGEDTVVEFEHSINTAMRKIREALGDDLEKPRFVETLPRKGYRFIAPVESIGISGGPAGEVRGAQVEAGSPVSNFRDKIPLRGQPTHSAPPETLPRTSPEPAVSRPVSEPGRMEEFALPRGRARYLFLLIQGGFLAMYGAALYKAEGIEGVLERVLPASAGIVMLTILVSAMCGIAVRLYLLSAVGLDHPEAGIKFRRLFPTLFALDALWSAAPLLLVREIGYGLALGSVAALAYLPFAQRTLMLSAYRHQKHSGAAANGASLPALRTLENASPEDDRRGG